jgi:hypothetical protein
MVNTSKKLAKKTRSCWCATQRKANQSIAKRSAMMMASMVQGLSKPIQSVEYFLGGDNLRPRIIAVS